MLRYGLADLFQPPLPLPVTQGCPLKPLRTIGPCNHSPDGLGLVGGADDAKQGAILRRARSFTTWKSHSLSPGESRRCAAIARSSATLAA